jgi:cell division protein FtsW (lipid II flippase)
MIGGFLSAIGGVLQMFLLNIPISTIKGAIDFIDSAGYIQYKTVSARIMGFERMSGLFSGPNDFGLYMSFIFSAVVFILYSRTVELFITMILVLVCLLLSFSRAGWAISVLTIFYLLYVRKIVINIKIIASVIFGVILIGVGVIAYIPRVSTIISNSISGKEASAAERGNIISRGIEMNLTEPFGHGLGKTDSRTGSVDFFVESAFLNIAYEIGILGLFILILIHVCIIFRMQINKRKWNSPFAFLAIGISFSTLIISFVSINPYGMPYIYIWWLLLGLGANSQYINLEVKQ